MLTEMTTALGPNDPDDGDKGRQRRGLAIAAITRIERNRIGYKVPSPSDQAPFALPIFHQPVKFYPMAATFNRRLGDPVVQLTGRRARPLRLSPPRVQGGPPRS